MSRLSLIIVVGQVSEKTEKETILTQIKEGVSSIPHFDTLRINEILSNIKESSPLVDAEAERFLKQRKHGVRFVSPESDIILIQDTTVDSFLEEVDKAINTLPQLIAIVYAGIICQSTGYWMLHDGVLKPDYLVDRVNLASRNLLQPLADTTKDTMPLMSLHIACSSVPMGGNWRHALTSHLPSVIAGRPVHATVNRMHSLAKKAAVGTSVKPELAPLPSDVSGVEKFCEQLNQVIVMPTTPPATSQPVNMSDGCSIVIQRPCLYIFPEDSGQSSIFAAPGLSLLVNAGASRDPKCWHIAQHLKNIDVILQTHWGVENTLGLASLLPALMGSSIEGSVKRTTTLLTPPPGDLVFHSSPPTTGGDAADPLVYNVAKLVDQIGQAMKPHLSDSRLYHMEVNRGGKLIAMPKPLDLYSKIGACSLVLYPLTPTEEDKAEAKKLAELWAKAAPNVATALAGGAAKTSATTKQAVLPLVSQLSVSALLVWKSHSSPEVLRILFIAANAHQQRVLTALEALHAGLPCLHQAEAHVNGPISSAMRKPAGTAGARSAATRTPGAPLRAKAAPKHVASGAAETRSARPAPSSGSAAAARKTAPATETRSKAPATKTEEVRGGPQKSAHEEKPKDEPLEEKVEVKTAVPPEPLSRSEETPLTQPTIQGDVETPEPEIGEELNGEGAALTSLLEAKDPNGTGHGVESAPLDAEPLNPLEDWGQPQSMPAPIAKSMGRPGAKAGSPAPTHPEGYYEASQGASRGSYEKLSKRTFVDVAFLPGGGDVALVDAEFFKRVVARYFVATTVAPTADLLKALVAGKAAWNVKVPNFMRRTDEKPAKTDLNVETTLILTNPTPALLEWASVNEKRLTDAKIDLQSADERSSIRLMPAPRGDGGDGGADGDANGCICCPGFRLNF